jgi:hypothetical protein
MKVEEKLREKMIDPSLLFRRWFWDSKIEGSVYVPNSFMKIKKDDIPLVSKYYTSYLSPERGLSFNQIKTTVKEYQFQEFYRDEFAKKVPEEFSEKYDLLKAANIEAPIKEIVLDEFVFLTTKSCVLSALKKVLKQYEKFNIFPLINFEKSVPDEWKGTVSGMKKYTNWIAFLGGFALTGNVAVSYLTSEAVAGIRLFLIDP